MNEDEIALVRAENERLLAENERLSLDAMNMLRAEHERLQARREALDEDRARLAREERALALWMTHSPARSMQGVHFPPGESTS